MRNVTRILIGLATLSVAAIAMAGPVNVNTADATTIAKELNGIGESRARAIVAWRERHGPFASVEDLARVKGVGQKLIRMNRENIRFEDPRAPSD